MQENKQDLSKMIEKSPNYVLMFNVLKKDAHFIISRLVTNEDYFFKE